MTILIHFDRSLRRVTTSSSRVRPYDFGRIEGARGGGTVAEGGRRTSGEISNGDNTNSIRRIRGSNGDKSRLSTDTMTTMT